MSLSRRSLLLGAAGAGGLSLLGGRARADADPRRRLLLLFVPNGMPEALWTPTGSGTGATMAPMWSALTPWWSDLAVVSGLANRVDGPHDDHASSAFRLLNATARAGTSFDQRIASAHAGNTPLRSLQLSSERASACPQRCEDRRHVAWRDGAPAPLDTSLWAVSRKLAATSDTRGTARKEAMNRLWTADLDGLVSVAGQPGLRRAAWADVLSQRASGSSAACPVVDVGADSVATYAEPDVMFQTLDLAVEALACGGTDVVTWMFGSAGSNRPLHSLGVAMGHHELSHASWWEAHEQLGAFVAELLAHTLSRLASVPVGDARLLDHTDVVLCSDMGNGSTHDPTRLPVVLAGAAARPVAGQHVVVANDRPIADLWLSLLLAHGVETDSFGDFGRDPLFDLS